MALSTESRRAGPYAGDGAQTEFTFGFKIFDAAQVSVVTSSEDGTTDVTMSTTLYSVTLNTNQDSSPGGTVTLTSPLEEGTTLSILSAVPYLQPMVLTNRGGFYPEVLNDSADRSVILAQQNRELIDRAIKVPASSSKTAEELAQELLSAQSDARAQADAAAASAAAAAKSEEKTAEYAEAATIILPYKDVIATVANDVDSVVSVGGSIDNVNLVADHIQTIDAVGGSIENVDAVATDLESVRIVASIRDQVVIDAGIADHIEDVAGIQTQVLTVSQSMPSVVVVSAGMPQVKTVAADLTSVTLDGDEDYGLTDDENSDVEDYGTTDDPVEGDTEIIGGNIVKVAEHIAAVQTNADNIELIAAAASNANLASSSALAAENAAKASQAAQLAAEGAQDLAERWATETETPVQNGLYGAKYYAEAAAESTTDAATAATQAAASATAAAGSATAAASSATEAEGSATAARTAATEAQGSATDAASSATAASTAKTGAEAAKTAAESAKSAAAASAEEAKQYAGQASTGQMQANWAETDAASKAFILNKPTTWAWSAITGKPTSWSWADITGKPTFATVATSGDYNDLANLPDLDEFGAQADWNATSGKAVILNKPTTWPWASVSGKPTFGALASKDTVTTAEVDGLDEILASMTSQDEDYGSTDQTGTDEDYGSTDLA